MRVSYANWKRPTDDTYAFRLRPAGEGGFTPDRPPVGARLEVTDTERVVLEPGDADRFAARIGRWSGPEDVLADGTQPFAAIATQFEERGPCQTLTRADLDLVLAGTSLVLRAPSGQVDYVLRDHHMLDVALHHYRCTGALPTALFHADRHSDYCRDGFLLARRPDQAATWWRLFEGLKRPGGAPVLAEDAIHFTTAKAPHAAWMSGRELTDPLVVPWFVDDTAWESVLARPAAAGADWVSLDLDCFQPSPQLALFRGLLRDERFGSLLQRASVRVFVLSPQFTRGGDKFTDWRVHGSRSSSLRLLNLLRSA